MHPAHQLLLQVTADPAVPVAETIFSRTEQTALDPAAVPSINMKPFVGPEVAV